METFWITKRRMCQRERKRSDFTFRIWISRLIIDLRSGKVLNNSTWNNKDVWSYVNVLQPIAIFDQAFEKHRETKTKFDMNARRNVYSRTRKVYSKSEAESAKTIRMTSRSRLKLEKPFSNKHTAYTQRATFGGYPSNSSRKYFMDECMTFSRTRTLSVAAKANKTCS